MILITRGSLWINGVQLIVTIVVVNITSTNLKLGAVKSGGVSSWVIVAIIDDGLLASYFFDHQLLIHNSYRNNYL